jgi:hypothetical protein
MVQSLLTSLPDELLIIILSHLSTYNLNKLKRVNRKIRGLCFEYYLENNYVNIENYNNFHNYDSLIKNIRIKHDALFANSSSRRGGNISSFFKKMN